MSRFRKSCMRKLEKITEIGGMKDIINLRLIISLTME